MIFINKFPTSVLNDPICSLPASTDGLAKTDNWKMNLKTLIRRNRLLDKNFLFPGGPVVENH